MRRAAAVHDRLLLQRTQTRRGLARRGDPGSGALGLGDERRGERRHAAEPPEEVQGCPLGGEDRGERPAQLRDGRPGREALAVLDEDLHGERRVHLGGGLLETDDAGEHPGLARDHPRHPRAGEHGAGQVAVAGQVLAQRAAHRRPGGPTSGSLVSHVASPRPRPQTVHVRAAGA